MIIHVESKGIIYMVKVIEILIKIRVMRSYMTWIAVLSMFIIQNCSGPNPNPGERTVDLFWHNNNPQKVFKILPKQAEKGKPWAQLRMGVAYELGFGVKKNIKEAVKWYNLTASHKGKGGWSNGRVIFSFGKPGFFNQNGDALVAKFQLSNIYLKGNGVKKDINKAKDLINEVIKDSKGGSIIYCCVANGGRWITQSMILDTKRKIDQENQS